MVIHCYSRDQCLFSVDISGPVWCWMLLDTQVYPGTGGLSGTLFRNLSKWFLKCTASQLVVFLTCGGVQELRAFVSEAGSQEGPHSPGGLAGKCPLTVHSLHSGTSLAIIFESGREV